MNPIGIMQGRLSPASGTRAQVFPLETWRTEFTLAAECGFSCLEWLVTADDFERNPLFHARGVEDIRALTRATGIRIATVCADFLISEPLLRVPASARRRSAARFDLVCEAAQRLGAQVVVAPLLEDNEPRTLRERAEVAAALAEPVSRLAGRGLRLAIESVMPSSELRAWIDDWQSAAVGVCYDSGNAAAAGYHARADLRELAAVVCAVHIKDRLRHGGSVPLGSGHADFDAVFAALAGAGYTGPLILETPVGADALASAQANAAFVRPRAGAAIAGA